MRFAIAYVLCCLLGVGLALTENSLLSQEKKADPPTVRVSLPSGWSKLGLSKAQTNKIYEVRREAKLKILDLEEQIRQIQVKERIDCIQLLTDSQKAVLRKLAGFDDEPAKKPGT